MLDLTDEFFQTAELLGQHSKEVLKLNGPFFSVTKMIITNEKRAKCLRIYFQAFTWQQVMNNIE